MNPKEIIKDLSRRDWWNFAELQSFFLTMRQLIEEDRTQSSFPSLNFYCNWCAHIKMEKSIFGLRLLSKLTEISLYHFAPGLITKEDYRKKNEDLFSVVKLRVEIITLLNRKNIPVPRRVINIPAFMNIVRLLFNYLQQKPVKFSGPRSTMKEKEAKIYDALIEQAKELKWFPIIEFYITTSPMNPELLALELVPLGLEVPIVFPFLTF